MMNLNADDVELMRTEFDSDFYADEYPDLVGTPLDLLEHFCQLGWFEGRNPNPYFDTTSYVLLHSDVAAAGVNPFFHYLKFGRSENRLAESGVLPSTRSLLLFGYPVFDWVSALREHVDIDYYVANMPGPFPNGFDPVAHFAFRGWREGLSASADRQIGTLKLLHPQAVGFLVNPLLAQVELRAGRYVPLPDQSSSAPLHNVTAVAPVATLIAVDQGADPDPQPEPSPEPDGAQDMDRMALIRTELSDGYYLSQNSDVVEAGVDPVEHYYYAGWREGRNPNKNFDTRYYLEANEDVRDAGVNPFWHYLVAGRNEGRAPCRPGGYRRRIIEAARSAEQRSEGYKEPPGELVARRQLGKRINEALRNARGLAVALSHDCYIKVIGGTQIFIADERLRFAERGYSYIHLSPRRGRLNLAPFDPEFEVQIVIDGEFCGFARIATFIDLLGKCTSEFEEQRLLVVHSVLGFHEDQVIELRKILSPAHSVFWLHDYTSICEGFNLLRNDLAFCHAPSADSKVCRVCVYGESRAQHLDRMNRLFEACEFNVLAPSAFTLDLWRRRADLPVISSAAHPHWQLEPIISPELPFDQPVVDTESPVRVGFVGFTSASKGWEVFSSLVDQFYHDARYQFVHFGARSVASLPECEFVVTETTPDDRDATTRLLHEHKIDFLAMLSPWPETFSFVAHEGVAAGCYLLCLKDSGNVAAMVRRTGCGNVFEDAAALQNFFLSDDAVAVALKRRAHLLRFNIVDSGTTATVDRFYTGTALT